MFFVVFYLLIKANFRPTLSSGQNTLEDAVADPVNSPGAGPHLVVPQLVQHFNLGKPMCNCKLFSCPEALRIKNFVEFQILGGSRSRNSRRSLGVSRMYRVSQNYRKSVLHLLNYTTNLFFKQLQYSFAIKFGILSTSNSSFI